MSTFVALGSSETQSSRTLQFFVGPFEQAKKTAKHMKLPIFVYVHKGKTAGNNSFAHTAVADLYQNNFINLKLALTTPEGVEFYKRHKLSTREAPFWMYFDSEGNLLGIQKGQKTPKELLHWGNYYSGMGQTVSYEGEDGLPRIYQEFIDMQNMYENGVRDPQFLRRFAYKSVKFQEPYEHIVKQYLDSANPKSKESLKFILDFATDVNSEAFDYLWRNQSYYSSLYSEDKLQAHIKNAINQSVIKAANKRKVGEMQHACSFINRVSISNKKEFELEMKMQFYQMTNNWEDYIKETIAFVEFDSKLAPDQLNNIAWNYAIHATDKAALQKALSWTENRLLKYDSSNTNYKTTHAALLYKNGKSNKALKYIEESIETARTKGRDYGDLLKLKNIIRQKTSIPVAFK